MSKHDQTRDGGRPRDQVDPSKIVRPKIADEGKHSRRDEEGEEGGAEEE
jgi:hypothetical protein